MNNKLIIHNYTSLPDYIVLHYIQKVVQTGLISETSKGKQYCFATRINDNYVVTCDKTNTGYRFKVVEDRYNENKEC